MNNSKNENQKNKKTNKNNQYYKQRGIIKEE